uniref:Uridine kinase n=1 Tax=Roseihalotalea indica TaxID=2867963 RepID=A0AA49GRA1_9BACT|nr:uridine kinase [Tunicatimonas sp. TK19036]
MSYTPYVVGITGGSGSGKTQFFHWVRQLLGEEHSCLISQDNYYKDLSIVDPLENRITNFDVPSLIEEKEFARDLEQLKNGSIVKRKEYTFNNPAVIPAMLEFKPAPIILVEGIFVFHFPEVARLLDLKVFIEAREHLKFHRRMMRDTSERGFQLDDVVYKYTRHVVPSYEKYIEPHKHEADLIFPNNREYSAHECPVSAKVLVSYLKTKLP